jgi:hypothetical protein
MLRRTQPCPSIFKAGIDATCAFGPVVFLGAVHNNCTTLLQLCWLTLQVNLISSSGTVTTVATVGQSTNWVDQVVKGSWDNVAAVQVMSNASFTLTEIALRAERCFEYATVDMKQVYPVSMIRCAHKNTVGQVAASLWKCEYRQGVRLTGGDSIGRMQHWALQHKQRRGGSYVQASCATDTQCEQCEPYSPM